MHKDDDSERLDKKKKGREILKLRTKELSLVDRPAVLETFLMVKRLEQEEAMGAFDSDQDDAGAVEVGYQWIDIDLEKRLGSDLLGALKPATEFLESVEKGEREYAEHDVFKAVTPELKTAISRVVAFLGKIAAGKYPYPKPAGKADEEEEKTQKALGDVADWTETEEVSKAIPDDLKKAIADVVSFLRKVSAGGEMSEKKTQKSQGTDSRPAQQQDTPDIGEVDVEKQVETYLTDLLKGKRFTDARKEGIATMAKQALALLSEVDPESVRKIITEKVQALKGEIKWPSGDDDEKKPEDMKKNLEEIVGKALEGFTEEIKKMNSRVEDIEKTRNPSQSGDSDATDTTVTKNESIWDGLGLPL